MTFSIKCTGPILLIIALTNSACKKSDSPPTPPSPPATSACILKSEVIIRLGTATTYVYQYDSKRILTQVNGTNRSAGQAYEFMFKNGNLTTINNGLSNVSSFFTGDLIAGVPAIQDYTGVVTDPINNTPVIKKYLYNYDSKKQLGSIIADAEPKVLLYYDGNGNVTLITYEKPTGPRLISNEFKITYDDKNAPYNSMQPYYKFMHHRFNWYSYDPWLLVSAISPHNPLRLDAKFYDGVTAAYKTYSEVFTYTYNARGYPTEMQMAYTDALGVTTSNYVRNELTYDCP